MSAFLCSDLHIATIAANVAVYFRRTIQEFSDDLKRINIQSVNFRYGENTRITKCSTKRIRENCSIADVHRLIECWDYQSCEGNSVEYQAFAALFNKWASVNNSDAEPTIQWAIH